MTDAILGASAQITNIAPDLTVIDGKVTTTSLQIAEHFGKTHKSVLRAIRNLECSPEYHQRNFAPTFREVAGPNNATRKDHAYRITRDGFTFLAMGFTGKCFTGKEAAQWKEAYIETFNRMEAALTAQHDTITPAQAQHLKELVDLIVASGRQKTHGETWKRFHRKMLVNSYLQLPTSRFDEGVAYLKGKMDDQSMAALVAKHFHAHALTATAQPFTAPPADDAKFQAALKAANAAAAEVHAAVMRAALADDANYEFRRWMLSFISDSRYGTPALVDAIAHDQCVSRTSEWAGMIRDPSVLISTTELDQIGRACMDRLVRRARASKALCI